jgi:hypothetical protein
MFAWIIGKRSLLLATAIVAAALLGQFGWSWDGPHFSPGGLWDGPH